MPGTPKTGLQSRQKKIAMFSSPIIDVAISLSFTYFMLSLIVSAFNEFIYSFIARRGSMLKDAIGSLLFDEDGKWKEFVTEKIYTSPQIQSLQKAKDKFPSYIPSENFVTAVIDSMREPGKLLDMNVIRTYLLSTGKDNILPGQLRLALLPMFERAQGDMMKFQTEIAGFYNNAMDRLTGWYKKETSLVIFLIALLICGLGNIDTINIVQKLWGNPDDAKHTAGQITNVAKTITYNPASKEFSSGDNSIKGIKGTYEITQQDTITKTQRKITVNLDNAAAAQKMLAASGVPIGWPGNGIENKYFIVGLLIKIAGWLVTALAVMLGAPFWFDLMNKFVNLRGAGKKPDDDKGSNVNKGTASPQTNAVG
jgi:hypothetical protein